MGRDGLLPESLSRCSERFRTPHIGTLVTGIFSAAFAGLLPLDLLGELISIGTLLAFAIVCAGIIILRRRMPDTHRPFRTPLVPLVPILGVISCLVLMYFLPISTWVRLAVWLVIGFAIYFGYGQKHSRLRDAP
jgi:basic amino acid/polyamine antiporter, APA family